jgi:glycosyltransferase involved in cell wall biosynthesis
MVKTTDGTSSDLESVQVSVVVPAYNVGKTIEACLDSLLSQTLPHQDYEVLVVDNGSTDDTAERIKKYPVKYLHVPDCTVYAARNTAVSGAAGEVIAFIDSDCVADTQWLEAGLMSLKQYDVVAGCVEPLPSTRKWLYAYDKYILRNPLIMMDDCVNIAALNAFVRKETFDTVGGFRDDINTASDSIFSMETRQMGFKVGYAPSAVVYHPVDGWVRKLRRALRESYGSKLKEPYLQVEQKRLVTRLANAWMLIQLDLRNLRQAWSRHEIGAGVALGVFIIMLFMRALDYGSVVTARVFGGFNSLFAQR